MPFLEICLTMNMVSWYKYLVSRTRKQSIGDWSSGMIGVSKTFGGSSILSSPVDRRVRNLEFSKASGFFIFWIIPM